MWTSSDSGLSFSKRSVEPHYWRAIASSSDGMKLAAVSNEGFTLPVDGEIWTSSDSGLSWTKRSVEPQYWRGIASSSDGTKLAAVARFSDIWTSTDSGKSWSVPYQ